MVIASSFFFNNSEGILPIIILFKRNLHYSHMHMLKSMSVEINFGVLFKMNDTIAIII